MKKGTGLRSAFRAQNTYTLRHALIRPLVYVEESDIIEYSKQEDFPIICCSCPVAGGEEQKRQRMKQLIKELPREIPQSYNSMISSLCNVHPRHLRGQTLSAVDR